MPDASLSAALKEAYASAPIVSIFDTLELRHPAFAAPIRVVAGFEGLTATLEAEAPQNPGAAVLFTAYTFGFRRPEVSMSAVPEVEITIDNVSREIVDNIEASLATTDMIEATYRPYLASNLTAPAMNPPMTVTIRHIHAANGQVQARASFGDLGNRRYPGDTYTAARFPGLVR